MTWIDLADLYKRFEEEYVDEKKRERFLYYYYYGKEEEAVSNRKKAKDLKGLRPTYSVVDEPAALKFGFAGRYNGYVCDACDRGFLTLDIHNGVTPMFSPCFATQGCTGRAHSLMYPQGDPPAEFGDPIIHWYRPTEEEFKKLPPATQDHVRQGGLVRKATATAPDWVKELM